MSTTVRRMYVEWGGLTEVPATNMQNLQLGD